MGKSATDSDGFFFLCREHQQRHRLRWIGDATEETIHHRIVDIGRHQGWVCDAASARWTYHLLWPQGIRRRRVHVGGGDGRECIQVYAQGRLEVDDTRPTAKWSIRIRVSVMLNPRVNENQA